MTGSPSAISKIYDLGNACTFVEVEEMMRAYDANNELDRREMCNIIRELRAQQKKLDDERKIILGTKRFVVSIMCVVTIALALAVMGAPFATDKLARRTSGEGDGNFILAANENDSPFFDSSSSWVGTEIRSRTQELLQGEKEHGRRIRQRNPRRKRQGNNVRSTDRGSTYRGGGDDWGECDNFRGTVDYSVYQNVVLSARSGKSKVQVKWKKDGFRYRKTVDLDSVSTTGDDDLLVLEARLERDNCSGNSCDIHKPIYVLKNCKSTRRTNRRDRNDDGDVECKMYSCELGIERSSSSTRKGDWYNN